MKNGLCEKSNCFCRLGSGSKQFDTVMIFLKKIFEKVDFGKISADDPKHAKLPSKQRVNGLYLFLIFAFPFTFSITS